MEASLRGEDRAVAILQDAIGLLVDDAATAKSLSLRRASDADRQRRLREKSQDVTPCHVTQRDGPKVSPDPFLTPKTDTPHHTARETAPWLAETMGDLWPSVERFLMRRDSAKWPGWTRQMTKEIGPGSQYTPADLAATCDDDEALKDPIGSPAGLRGFLLKSRTERVENGAKPANGNGANGGRFPPRRTDKPLPQVFPKGTPTTSASQLKWPTPKR